MVERVGAEVRARGASGVHRLCVSVGELAGVEPDLLSKAFATFRDRTVCEHAELELRMVPARWECPSCARAIAAGEVLSCPACGLPARLAEGDEIMLDRIELEVP